MVSLDFLKKVEVFKGLDNKQFVEIQSCCEEKAFNRGDKIFAEGDDADYLWIVTDGKVDVRFDLPKRPTSAEYTISPITEAQAFGWSSLLPFSKYTLSAYCASDNCKVVQLAKPSFTNLFKKDDKMGYHVMSNAVTLIGSRFQKLQDMVTKQKGVIL